MILNGSSRRPHVARESPPERAQQRQQQERFLAVAARLPTGTRQQRRWAAVTGHLNGQLAQREQMQPTDERESIEVQGRAPLALGTQGILHQLDMPESRSWCIRHGILSCHVL
jgi:hypothetical protein